MSLNLITLTDPQSPAAEAYRALRTNLEFAGLDSPLKAVLFTAPTAEEDTATTVANLAVTIAQTERDVVVVDANLRQPHLHEIFGLSNDHGLTDMVKEARPFDAPPILATEVPHLSLIPAGPTPLSPADVLDSKRLLGIWEGLRERFDMVLVNTPPILAVTDAAILAPRMDGVLLVLRAGRTRRQHALAAKERLERVRARLLGAVLLDAPYDKAVQQY